MEQITILRILRALKGITQAELARRLGVSAQTWSRVESGDRHLTPQELPRLAEARSLTPEDLQSIALPPAGHTTRDDVRPISFGVVERLAPPADVEHKAHSPPPDAEGA
jgi:transcriptional regulator with XRE-family HTH domain